MKRLDKFNYADLRQEIMTKFVDRISYYEKQKLSLPRSAKIKSRIRELKYMKKEIENIFSESEQNE